MVEVLLVCDSCWRQRNQELTQGQKGKRAKGRTEACRNHINCKGAKTRCQWSTVKVKREVIVNMGAQVFNQSNMREINDELVTLPCNELRNR